MKILRELLVPVDGSEATKPAVEFALQLAKGQQASICFCHAVDLTGTIAECSTPYGVTDVAPILQALEEESKVVLAAMAARAAAVGVVAETVELAGPPVGAIVDAAREGRADAIVMATHGRHGVSRFFLGSTAAGVLRRADVPVFVVRGGDADAGVRAGAFSRILVAFDDSEPADAALEFALDLAEPGTTKLVLVHAINIRELYELAASQRYAATAAFAEERAAARALLAAAAERAKGRGVDVEILVVEGEPVESMLELAKAADLVAIGTHGRRGLRRLFFGSVAEGVVRGCPAPVVVVRHRFAPPSGGDGSAVGATLEAPGSAPQPDAPREPVSS
jgi:nucleotide-binding universal stress UspA family protein